MGPSRFNEEPCVLDGSTGPGKKARPLLTLQKSLKTNQRILANHPGLVLPPSGDGSPSGFSRKSNDHLFVCDGTQNKPGKVVVKQ